MDMVMDLHVMEIRSLVLQTTWMLSYHTRINRRTIWEYKVAMQMMNAYSTWSPSFITTYFLCLVCKRSAKTSVLHEQIWDDSPPAQWPGAVCPLCHRGPVWRRHPGAADHSSSCAVTSSGHSPWCTKIVKPFKTLSPLSSLKLRQLSWWVCWHAHIDIAQMGR